MFNQSEGLNIGLKAKHFATVLHMRDKISKCFRLPNTACFEFQSDTPTIHRPTIVVYMYTCKNAQTLGMLFSGLLC